MTDTTPAPAQAPASKSVVVTLAEPIKREGGDIASLTIRKPKGGDLRGTKLTDLVAADVDAVAKVIPRITTPAIVAHEFYGLEADDFAEVVGTVVGFFLNQAQREAMQAMTAA
ncbi:MULTISPECIES: phage tail assembly protein [unclassified Novosphingobium]|uniref:phage tail assembly protein n=1 Tax=unclassified Novosphingobium TaxID=2644732 RepID=UPI000D314C8F|nr:MULTISPECIES: phage tail assembly protein [unclassified Novosphingobium]PTR08912.1 tail assembly chaperone E/41/14-like protein [Novosphingobium sp. GV055]PUB01824.1 tail assembly chaperone E/41/14-like protein [Novosphingobium sp. GV061]PUB17796.1 tail assembly chaperone E/41/14-like protein [Novosphingobium sp. GV079]PUB40490.1 tail assembly chaperone E/41/14-like protein [Novosphingobium sp. GV027]